MAVSGGKVLGGAASGAAAGSVLGPWGTAGGAIVGGLLGALSGGDNAAPQAPPAQFGNNELTNQLAAQQYAAGLQQQQAQNAREAGFYNQANGNFDVANAAQMRAAPTISSSLADKQRQLAALGGTNAAIGNINQTGAQLTALGTRDMGPSYAEAQLRQGLDASLAQQLAMARSGRSLGSGQAAMNQAAFNNAALNQQTNLAAANARIQEQNAYNQFQAGALNAAGQQYGAAGALSGQAGNQATAFRQGNEAVQAQNAALAQSQQGINNQTTGLYNQLGAQQQQLGMQANQLGQGAFQFGANQALGMQQAQLNANVGQTSGQVATNLANQQNANLHDAATANAIASAAGGMVQMAGSGADSGAASTPTNPNDAYANITTSSHVAGPTVGINANEYRSSDERTKTNIKALEPKKPGMIALPGQRAAAPAQDASGPLAGYVAGQSAGTQAAGVAPRPVSYAETIAALNAGYRPSQFAPTDVLNHVPGAGAGHSASQDAVIAQMQGRPVQPRLDATLPGGINAVGQTLAMHAPVSGDQLSAFGQVARRDAAPPSIQIGQQIPGAPRLAATPVAPALAWGDVFNAPQLDPRIAAYLNGASPYSDQSTPSFNQSFSIAGSDGFQGTAHAPANYHFSNGIAVANSAQPNGGFAVRSDARSKTRIRELEGQLAALGGPVRPEVKQPDTAALDASEYGQQVRGGWRNRDQLEGPESYPHRWDAAPFATAPAVDLRSAQGYSYEYKDPSAPGASPGRHVGPMAQDLENTAAAGTVYDTPVGKQVDTPRLTMVNTAAISELQRKMQELEALGGGQRAAPAYRADLYPQTRAPY